MKKTIQYIAFSIILLAGCAKDYSIPEGLVVGLSFEDDVVHPQVFSSYLDLSPPVARLSQEEAFDGIQSLQLMSADPQYPSDIHWGYRHEDLTDGSMLKVVVRVKGVKLEGNGFFMEVIARDKDTFAEVASAKSRIMNSSNEEWLEIELILDQVINPNIAVVDIFMKMSRLTSGSVYYDKLEIIEIFP